MRLNLSYLHYFSLLSRSAILVPQPPFSSSESFDIYFYVSFSGVPPIYLNPIPNPSIITSISLYPPITTNTYPSWR